MSLLREVFNALKRRRHEIAVTATVVVILITLVIIIIMRMSIDTETKITIETIPSLSEATLRQVGVVKIYWKDASRFSTTPAWNTALQYEDVDKTIKSGNNFFSAYFDHIALNAGGEEMKVLRAFPFKEISVSAWSISSKSKVVRDELIPFMSSKQYDCVVHDGKRDADGARDVICLLKINEGSEPSVPSPLKAGKHTVYVISLQGVPGADAGNEGRFDKFVAHWKHECGESIQIQLCPGILDPRRGYGLTRTYVQCISKAIADRVVAATFLEDDARLFPNVKKFCSHGANGNMFEKQMPRDAFILMLGGHGFEFPPRESGDGNGLRFMHALRSVYARL